LFQHNHVFPIGTWANVRVEGNRLVGKLKLAKKGTSRLIDEIHSLIEQRILKSISIGFFPKKYEPLDKDNPWNGYRFSKVELFEASLVSVPANPSALSLAKSVKSPALKSLLLGRSPNTRKHGGRRKSRLTIPVRPKTGNTAQWRMYLGSGLID
jgi:HK97 family phage prohead protease